MELLAPHEVTPSRGACSCSATTLDEIVDRVRESYATEAQKRVQTITDEYEAKLQESEARRREATLRADEAARAKDEARQIAERSQAELVDLVARERSAAAEAEGARRTELLREKRARRAARLLTTIAYGLIAALVLCGAVALILGHPIHSGWLGIGVGIAVIAFVALETFGILRHVSELRASATERLTRRIRDWLRGEKTDSWEN